MELDLFDYQFDEKLIAKYPLENRDEAKLLVVDVKNFKMEHRKFYNISDYIDKNDVVVVNNSFVKKARIFGRRLSGGKVEIFVVHFSFNISFPLILNVLLKSHKTIKEGEEILITEENRGEAKRLSVYKRISGKEGPFKKLNIDTAAVKNVKTADCLKITVLKSHGNGNYDIVINNREDSEFIFDKCGQIPLPPYLKRDAQEIDAAYYQTVYADDVNGYSVAAPTAGLHFTEKLMGKINDRGGIFAGVSLNIGLGTFLPVRERDIRKHDIHEESYTISKKTAQLINNTLESGNKIIITGTSSVRCMESCADNNGFLTPVAEKPTSLYIYPGYKFKVTRNLITNFHQPKSSLFIMICALIGIDKTKAVYEEAIKNGYSLFSYGDAVYLHNI